MSPLPPPPQFFASCCIDSPLFDLHDSQVWSVRRSGQAWQKAGEIQYHSYVSKLVWRKKLNLLSLRSQDNKNKGILRFWGLLWQFVRSRTISESQETLNWTDSVARPLPIDRASFETQTWAINMHSRCPIAGQLAAHKVLHLHFSRVFNVSVKSKSLLLSQGKKW